MIAMLLVWCHLLTGYEPELVHNNLCKTAPRPPLLVVQVHGERVSPKGHKFEPLSVCTLYTCGSVAGQLQVRESVRYITHNSYAISVVSSFNIFFSFKFSITLQLLFTFLIILINFYSLYYHVSFS